MTNKLREMAEAIPKGNPERLDPSQNTLIYMYLHNELKALELLHSVISRRVLGGPCNIT